MNNKELTLQEIHEHTLKIHKKIVEICELIKIDYSVTYGTLLGAVRHKGYIPWDDDFDIMMLRGDYDKFLEYCENNKEELKPFCLMNYHNTDNYTFAISRFCDMRYTMVTDDGNDLDMGMFIDIYPYDGMGNDQMTLKKKKRMERKNKFLWMGLYYSDKNNTIPKSSGTLKNVGRKVFCIVARLLGRTYFVQELEKIAHRYTIEESEYIDCVIWDCVKPNMKKEWFMTNIDLEFEGMKVRAPKEYDKVLRKWYGDYMKMPPEEQRVPHHQYKLYKL